MEIILAGASRLVGNSCLEKFMEDEKFSKIKVITRRKIFDEAPHKKIEEVIVDFDNLKNYSEKFRGDAVVCALGTTIKKAGNQENFKKVDFDYVIALADAALESNVQKFFVVSAMGADPNSKVFYNRVKGEMETALKNKKFPALYILQPSLLLGERDEFRLGESVAKILMKIFSPLIPKNYRAIESEEIADAIVKKLKRSEEGIFIYKSGEIKNISGSES